ncbi:hypothetical protein [Chitinophaga sp. CF418]|uniref:hypothetical protein n=1 Tax=Chitinophaga sp. CF418 TaxID=1855287 RepID=UPI00091F5443|nr:hypothetical protein [Chitinophaga sp. CF418]SHM75716.1 hypothetical protein SAMN05216311_103167 [Chitinophaga sp. CF418]
MSGKDSLRGYVFQTIISVIKALSDDSWEYVSIEPSTPEDKVDIIWTGVDESLVCQQVKSSTTNFGKPEIIRWIEGIINDVPTSNEYQLILVGTIATGVESFINDITKKQKGFSTGSQLLDDNLSKISAEIIPFKPDFMEAVITNEVSRFLSGENFQLPHSSHQLIAGGLIYQFFQFSIFEKRIHRTAVAELMIDWAKSNYQREFGAYTHSRNLLLSCYTSNGTWENTFSCTPLILDLFKISYFHKGIKEVFAAFQDAISYELPARKTDIPLPDASPFPINLMKERTRPAEFDKDQKDFVSTRLKLYFDIEPPPDFFNVGELNWTIPTLTTMLTNGNSYEGTEDEKKKNEYLRKLYFRLKEIDELVKCINCIESFFALPVAIRNMGSFDEDIKLEIKIPNNIQVLTAENLYIPEDEDVLESLMDNDFLFKSLVQPSNSVVSEYPDTLPFTYMKMPSTSLHYFRPELKYMKSVFKRAAESIFDNKLFTDRPGFTVLKYTFRQLNPHQSVFLPTYLFLKSEKPFAIEYNITSKHTLKVTTETLNISPITQNKDRRSLYERLIYNNETSPQ